MKALYTIIFLLIGTCAFAQSNVIPDNIEFQVLKNLWDSTNGSGWLNKTNWPASGSWPSSATSAQFGTWYGVTVTNGDITAIQLSNNTMTGQLPSSIGQLKKLITLTISGSSGLTGPVPASIGNLKAVTYFNLSGNNLSGEIPSTIGGLTAVSTLGLQNNKLTGQIPSTLGSLTNLGYLYLNNNQLSGTIPDVFQNVTNLRYFSVGYNQLTGSLPPSLGNSIYMTAFTVTSNKLTGNIPSSYANFTVMTNFYVNINDLSGDLPSFIGSWVKMVNFNVSTNRFTGTIPSGISNWTSISSFFLSKNRFTGAFPTFPATYFTYIDASDNAFTSLPSSVTSGSALTQLYFQNNNLTTIPDFGSYSNRTNLYLNVQNNRLDFSKLEPLVGKGIKSLTQTPQKNVNDIATTPVSIGSSLTITARSLGTGTTINWEKLSSNGSTWTSVDSKDDDGSGNNTFKRNTATKDDEGTYRWKTTSSIVTGLTIYSDAIAVKTSQEFTLDNWAFQYKYDGRKRMTHKKVPGADWVYMVYDDRDRLVMTQDGEQRKSNNWTVTKYDLLNRPVVTAIYTHSNYLSQQGMDSLISKTLFAESLSGATYTTSVFPTTNLNILTQTYYDDYNFLGGDSYFSYKTGRLSGQETSAFTRVKGMVTGVWTSVLGKDKQWLRAVNYYDDKGRVIQTISDNHKRDQDVTTNVYDFVGKIIDTKTESMDHNIRWTNYHPSTWFYDDRVQSKGGSTTMYAYSTQTLGPNVNGWVEFNCSDGSLISTHTFGFSPNTTGTSTVSYGAKQDITATTNKVYVMEGTTVKANTDVVAGDIIRVARISQSLYYYKNGVAFYNYTPTTAIGGLTFYAHTTLVQTNSTLYNPKISVDGATRTTQRHFEYDHVGRLTKTWHSLDGAPLVLLSKQEYNELGQLIDKKLHSTNSTDFRQSIDYRYNIRGWLTSMNGADLNPTGSKNQDDAHTRKDLFGIDLLYNDQIQQIGNSKLYNGNISAMRWSNNLGLGTDKERAYKFDYDAMNRLNAATQKTSNGISWSPSSAFQEAGVTYDLNGNIITLNRTDAAGATMDQLSYDYGANDVTSNALLKVTDTGTKDGFSDVLSGDNDYTYDKNGNLVTDNNKSITSITYNHLNLPEKVTKSTNEYLVYTYDATGRKLTQDVYTSAGVIKKKSDYVGEWFYENDTLRFVNHEEGRAVTEGTWTNAPQLLPDPEMTTTSNYLRSPNTSVVTLNAITDSGKSYLKVTTTATSGTSGFTSTSVTVVPGRSYTMRLKGYNTSSTPVKLYVLGAGYSSGTILWPGAQLPDGAANENWVEATFTVPMTMSVVQIGALWTAAPTSGSIFYVNNMELREYNGIHGNNLFTQSGYTYQYHLKDHLGNVRMTFTTKDEKETSLATLETTKSDFLYYDEAVKINSTIFDHTDTASTHYSARLNGTPKERYGLAKSLSVMPGDTINMQVFAKYLNPNSATWTSTWSDFFTSISPGGTPPAGTIIDGGLPGSTGGLLFPFWALFAPPPTNDNEDAPKAYLNWLVFDRNYNLKDGGALQISTAAEEHGQNGSHEELSKHLPISEAGYVYVYLSNDNVALGGGEVEVYWDDFRVEQVKSPVIQSEDFYPFGLTFDNSSRESALANQYQYNGKEKQDELGLDWIDYGARIYMSDIGRWSMIDPLSDLMRTVSPYSYTFNNPIRFIDPDGMKPGDPFKSIRRAARDFGETYNDNSIQRNQEMASTIYRFEKDGKTYYSYSPPAIGNNAGASPSKEPEGTEAVAIIHTHAAYDPNYVNNEFAPQDKQKSKDTNLLGYLVTPNGSLKRYNPKTGLVVTIGRDMPSDDKDPTRKNNVDFRQGPKDEPTETFLDWLKQKEKDDQPPKFDNRKETKFDGRYPDNPHGRVKKKESGETLNNN